MEGVGLGSLSLLLLHFLPRCFSEQSVPLEQVEVFLQLTALGFVECQVLLRRGGVSFLEVDWIDVIHSYYGQQKDANILGVDLILLEGLVCFMDEGSLMVVLAFFFHSYESHFLEYFVEENILNLCLGGRWD